MHASGSENAKARDREFFLYERCHSGKVNQKGTLWAQIDNFVNRK